ncbi:MAG: alginate lyase family protein, partial [Clostridia bacterium]|nr:alginate lyase family protein [Clostridia bacterium]
MEKNKLFLEFTAPLASDSEIAAKYADHLAELFGVIEPSRIGADFACAMENGDIGEAIKSLAAYYRAKPDFTVSDLSAKGGYSLAGADNAINGIMREVNIDWTFPNGDVDFLFDPTELKGPRNHEWLWQFNRHGYWCNMARAYVGTGDEKYARAFRAQLLKWIAQTYIPEKWNGPGSAWRTIECGIRLLGVWQIAYDGFRRSPEIDDVTLLLMIASMHRQSTHLVEHPTGGNWLMMESNGVYTFSALFPELTDSEKNRRTASERLLRELEKQILPDGMHNELSPDYQIVVYNCATNFYSLAVALGLESEVSEGFVELIKKTVNAAILLSTPAFTQPRTNDCYTITTVRSTARTSRILGDKPEYRFVNTNRAEGEPPVGETASAFLPYAGFAVMRSDWGADATYMCFDVGPLGTGHMHQDKLNINIYKGSEELIYDDGGGQYEISRARTYALSGYGHNTVLVDGLAQQRKAPLQSSEPIDAGWITNDIFDYAVASYTDTYGGEMIKPATQTREVRFCKPGFFCVSDTMRSADGNAHDYEILFHLDTTKVKPLEGYENGVISDFGRKYDIVIIPVDDPAAKPELCTVSAATEPQFQGWYNGRNESYLHEAITVSRKVSGVKDYRFTTLLFPVEAGADLPRVENADGILRIS